MLFISNSADGIGKAYAFALAKKGMSIMLISRTESKLQDVKKEIEAKGYDGVEVSCYPPFRHPFFIVAVIS